MALPTPIASSIRKRIAPHTQQKAVQRCPSLREQWNVPCYDKVKTHSAKWLAGERGVVVKDPDGRPFEVSDQAFPNRLKQVNTYSTAG